MDSLLAFTANLPNFHFLRPLWLLLLVPAPILLWLLKRRTELAGAWQKVIDPKLQSAMLEQNNTAKKQTALWPFWAIAWLIAVIAVAGPSYKKMPQPVSKNQQALIILLDMSASMAAQDLAPSRATRAIQKITDIVRSRSDGITALVVYSGDAHTVTPLTDDRRTIETLLPALSPFIMPAPGSRPEKAVKLARELANNAGVKQADLLLITDGIETKDIERINNELRTGLKLSVITVGTKQGAPIPMPRGGFLRDSNNQIVLPSLNTDPIKELSKKLNVPWRQITLNDSDWQSLVSQPHELEQSSGLAKQEFDLWRDDGFWLILLIVPFALLLFRRGVLLCLPLVFWLAISTPQTAEASPWYSADQQGAQLFEQNPEAAAQTFANKAWQGSAYYRAGDYENATKAFKEASTGTSTAENLYNLGNALAQNGQYKEAIKAYDQALKKQPDFPAAVKNKRIVEDALKQQEQQNGDGESDSDDPSENNDEQSADNDKQDQGKSNDDSQSDDSQNQDSDSQDSQNQDAQNKDSKNQDSGNNDQKDDPYNPQKEEDKSDEATDPSAENSASEKDEDSAEDNDQADVEAKDEPANEEPTDENSAQAASANSDTGLSREEQEAMQKWLQRVPDNPGNLLQRKFLYQYRQTAPENTDSGEVQW